MTPRHYFLAALVSSTVLASMTGCGKSASQSAAEMAVATATGGKLQVSQSGDQSQMTIKTDQGEVKVNTGGNVSLPKDFPSDVHMPASYSIKNAMTAPTAVILDLHTPAAQQAVYSEYDSSMKSGGWTEAMAMQSAQSASVLSFQKDKRNVLVSIAAAADSGGGTDVHLQISSEQK